MPDRHVALIVEDEPEMAAEMADLIQSFGHDAILVETKADAVARLDEGGFCYVLLDLQIKAERGSIRPRVDAGMSLLQEIRRRYPRRAATDMHLLPVLIVSGHAKEHEDTVKAFQWGADDFIQKPLGRGGQDIGLKIQHCLDRADRRDHGSCQVPHGVSDAPQNQVTTFVHAPDYSEVSFYGQLFLFEGTIQRRVIGSLHEAAKSGTPWQSGKATLKKAGSQDTRMGNLFGHHPCWGTLLLSNGHGQYRLKTE